MDQRAAILVTSRIIAVAIWAYSLFFAFLMGNSIPSLITSLRIEAQNISMGISLVFLAIPVILFFGIARAGWKSEVSTPKPGYFVDKFGEERVAGVVRAIRPKTLLMVVAGLIGAIGVGTTLLTTRSAASYCLSSYFLAVGAGHLYAYLFRNNDRP